MSEECSFHNFIEIHPISNFRYSISSFIVSFLTLSNSLSILVKMKMFQLLCFILLQNLIFCEPSEVDATEFLRYDGWYNNLDHIDMGTPGMNMIRIGNPAQLQADYLKLSNFNKMNFPETARNKIAVKLFPTPNSAMTYFLINLLKAETLGSESTQENACPIEKIKLPFESKSGCYDGKQSSTIIYRSSFDKTTDRFPGSYRKMVSNI